MSSELTQFKAGVKNWMLRSKHGRDKIFKTPEDLWAAAVEYFKSVDDNPWYDVQLKTETEFQGGSSVVMVEVPLILPYTIQDMCIFWGVGSRYWHEFKARAKDNYPHFLNTISIIDDVIYSRKYKGAATNRFNAQFIGKDIGLIDRQMVGNDPDNPMPSPVTFYIPDNGRGSSTPALPPAKKEIPFYLD